VRQVGWVMNFMSHASVGISIAWFDFLSSSAFDYIAYYFGCLSDG